MEIISLVVAGVALIVGVVALGRTVKQKKYIVKLVDNSLKDGLMRIEELRVTKRILKNHTDAIEKLLKMHEGKECDVPKREERKQAKLYRITEDRTAYFGQCDADGVPNEGVVITFRKNDVWEFVKENLNGTVLFEKGNLKVMAPKDSSLYKIFQEIKVVKQEEGDGSVNTKRKEKEKK